MISSTALQLELMDPGQYLDLSTDPTSLLEELRTFLQLINTPRLRSMAEFAEKEIRPKRGPHRNLLFKLSRQPFTAIWFALIASGLWNRFIATGPSQSGKTLCAFIIPMLFHLFEMQEDVICLVPDWSMAKDKWVDDLLPNIENSRYKALLPTSGPGSRGGSIGPQSSVIAFKNGASIKFMTGGGDDKSRAGKTVRVLMITEADGMDEAGGESREGDKISQTIKRTASFGDDAIIYLECTVSIATGATWQGYTNGTQSELKGECPSCHAWVTPERENLEGYQDAKDELDAKEKGCFSCPACGVFWTEEQRHEINANLRVVHRGQTIDETGEVSGPLPRTETLGFRWNAFNNLFLTSGYIAKSEYEAVRNPDQESAEKVQLQFMWAKPYVPDITAQIQLDARIIAGRITTHKPGIVPASVVYLEVGCDLGQEFFHVVVTAFLSDGTCHQCNYGHIRVHSATLGVEIAIWRALHELRELCLVGWEVAGGLRRIPDYVFIDSGKWTDIVYRFCREYLAEGKFWPVKGFGQSTNKGGQYHQPESLNAKVVWIGEQCHISLLSDKGIYLFEINVDHWKSWLQRRFQTAMGTPGAMSLYNPEPKDHFEYAKHMVSETSMREWVKGRGFVETWTRVHRKNHYLDASVYACVAGHFSGFVLLTAGQPTPPPPPEPDPEPDEDPEDKFIRPVDSERGHWIRRRSD